MALTKDFGFGPDEQLVRDQARKFLRDNVPIDKLRTLVAGNHHEAYESAVQPAAWDQTLWKQIVELGQKREVYIKEELKKQAQAQGKALDDALRETLREQAGQKGIKIPE